MLSETKVTRRATPWLLLCLATLASAASRPATAQPVISADGIVESETGGFMFPDGSLQQTAATPIGECPTLDPSDEMVWVGGVCIDKYEASIWDAPVGGNQITNDMAIPCSIDGQDCDDIFARSVAGVEPRHNISWFQAQAALANSGKRLLTNAEWQMAVMGTPEPPRIPGDEDCNTNSGGPEPTGERANCVSRWGLYDLVGNLWEWVADWVAITTACPGWGNFSDDWMCLAGAAADEESPGAIFRGGYYLSADRSGAFAIAADTPPWSAVAFIGFRGAR